MPYNIAIHYSRHSDSINFKNLSLFANKNFQIYNNNNCDDLITLYCKVSLLNNIKFLKSRTILNLCYAQQEKFNLHYMSSSISIIYKRYAIRLEIMAFVKILFVCIEYLEFFEFLLNLCEG